MQKQEAETGRMGDQWHDRGKQKVGEAESNQRHEVKRVIVSFKPQYWPAALTAPKEPGTCTGAKHFLLQTHMCDS